MLDNVERVGHAVLNVENFKRRQTQPNITQHTVKTRPTDNRNAKRFQSQSESGAYISFYVSHTRYLLLSMLKQHASDWK